MVSRSLTHRILIVLAIMATTATGLYVHAEEQKKTAAAPTAKSADPEKAKVRKEYQDMRKSEYLNMLGERENYYVAMAEEMRAVRKACGSEDKDACKKAKEHAKLVREKFADARKANIEKFKAKVDAFRKKLGEDLPTDVEKEHQELKAKQEKPAKPLAQ